VSGLLLGSHAAAASAVGRIDLPAETSAAGSGVGDRWHGHLGRMASRVDGFGSHPVDRAVDGGSSDAEQFGELSLGVIP
jgi:hypothetical protein